MHKKKCMEIIRFNGHSSTVQKGQSIHSYITWYWTFVQCQSLCFFKVLLLKVKKVLTHSATVTYKPSNKNCKAATKLWGGKGTYSNGKYINIEINEGGCHPPVAQSTNEQTRQKWDLVVQQKFKVSEEPNTSLKQLRAFFQYTWIFLTLMSARLKECSQHTKSYNLHVVNWGDSVVVVSCLRFMVTTNPQG